EALKCCYDIKLERCASPEKAFAIIDASDTAAREQKVALTSAKGSGIISFPDPRANMAAGTLQDFLDGFLKDNPQVVIDYIHGTESMLSLAAKPGNLGLYLPPIDKGGFFGTVIRDGVMPRKTFSMGEAPEKRFYIEARRITK
ncbi:MAG TPA: DUF1015 domain-containing protein, partial [Rectinemataceae bacterium]|nr:DUF1015 domain-containing protein [Rectinemataceae bacterium]